MDLKIKILKEKKDLTILFLYNPQFVEKIKCITANASTPKLDGYN